ncbi:glutamate racemase [Pelagirhabdus alkalitolerans]|uniref:Glutamate racemase n=1 Tax=Pelagirhabdus alkalitolerans TaxID=1612202 RepID=A0A1G6HLT7_9BACI|nr:glutamate racemase [Pelagirhabdus alkalitolerans]SDB95267.1 glutamate racemase [Pelagirhabdus alkalitolerans]
MDRPIGVIDSGVGGLTVARELMRQLPKEQLIYLGDTVRCPYGPRPKEEVVRFTTEMVTFLMEKQIKMLVIACNTATAFTLDYLREKLTIPVIGVIDPGARAAIKVTETKAIGVIGTEGTIKSQAYPEALKQISAGLNIYDLACPQFVPLVESGHFSSEAAEQVVETSLEPLKRHKELDTLILGCTHYPLLTDWIQKAMGEHVSIISSGEETAREVSAIMSYQKIACDGKRIPDHQFYTTGSPILFEQIANRWMDYPVNTVEQIVIDQT